MVSLTRLAFAVAVSLSALFGVAAQLRITNPGGPDLWWVAGSQNIIEWTCRDSPYDNYTVLVANSDPRVLTAPIAIVAIINNFDCSKTISKDQANQPPGTGYKVQLADPFNSTNIYAESQEFEIKPLGATYPTRATPGTVTNTGATPTATGKNSAFEFKPSFAFGAALAAAILGILIA